MPRCFIAIPIPATIRPSLLRAQAALVSQNPSLSDKIRLTPEQNLHLTLKFLGDTDPSQMAPLKECLDQLSTQSSLRISQIKGISAFPTHRQPRAIFAKIATGQSELESLGKRLDDALTPHGFPPATKKRIPHITLARLARNTPASELESWLESQKEISFGELASPELALYKSVLHPDGSIYEILHRNPLCMGESP